LNNPEDVDLAVETMCVISREVQRISAEHGIRPLLVYLPPPMTGQPHFFEQRRAAFKTHLGVDGQALEVNGAITDAWINFAQRSELAVLDLRPIFRGRQDLLYWEHDSHLNLAGHALVAQLIQAELEATGDELWSADGPLDAIRESSR